MRAKKLPRPEPVPIEPGFLKPVGDGWKFLRAPKFWFLGNIPVGGVLRNTPAPLCWAKEETPFDPEYKKPIVPWSINFVLGSTRFTMGIPEECALEILEASGASYGVSPKRIFPILEG